MGRAVALTGKSLNAVSAVSPRAAGRIAFSLFCHPVRRGAIRPRERTVIDQAVRGTVHVAGSSVATYRWGDGENAVLLMHGWASRASRFASLVAALRTRGISVLAFDAPGHGDSRSRGSTVLRYTAVARALSERHGPFRAIIGHSFGALCGFHAVKSHVPTARLVAISGPSDFAFLLDEFSNDFRLRPAIRAEVVRRIERHFQHHLTTGTDLWARFSPCEHAEEVTVPVLIVHDEDDQRVPVSHARRLTDVYLDRVGLVITSGLGHGRILGDPRVLAAVADFVAAPAERAAATGGPTP